MRAAILSNRWTAPAIVFVVSLLMGYFHNRWIYPFVFHADTAAMQVMGQAILDELSLLPADFVYGNQLILFRSPPFIAGALAAGFTGYDAFVVGSAVSLAAWALALYAILHAYLGGRGQAAALTLVFLIPMGFWENDYVLGQQSHLSNVVISLGIVLCAWLWLARERRGAHLWSVLLMFLMCAEAPIRAVLVLLPLALASLLLFDFKRALRFVLLLGAAFVAGFVVNKLLLSVRPVAVNLLSTYQFRSLTEMFETIAMLTKELVISSSSVDLLHRHKLGLPALVLFGAGLCWVIGLYGYAIVRARAALGLFTRIGEARAAEEGLRAHFPVIVALLGIVIGAVAVSSFNPDTGRHFLWAYALLKLSFLIMLYRLVTVTLGLKSWAFGAVALLALLASVWAGTVLGHKGQLDAHARARLEQPIELQIARIAREQRIGHVFGPEFWRMHSLNSTVPGVAAGVLEHKGSELVPFDWLSRRSWFNQPGPVMYYLKDTPADHAIIAKLQQSGGKVAFASPDGQIWIGGPVWDAGLLPMRWRGCELPARGGRATSDCQVEKADPAHGDLLTYGPYVKLRAATYAFELDYEGGGRYDVTIAQGSGVRVMAAGDLAASQGHRATASGRFAIDTADSLKALELRTFSQAGVPLKVHELRIRRVQ